MEQAAAPSHTGFCPSILLLGPHASTLIRELDGWSRLALFRTSKVARDEVLISAENVMCHINITAEDVESQLAHARDWLVPALVTRGTRPTRMELQWECEDPMPMVRALDVLKEASAGIHELEFYLFENVVMPTSLVEAAARSFPNLKSLQFPERRVEAMPRPSLFPHLTALTLYTDEAVDAAESLVRSVAPYLSRLTQLTLESETIEFPAVLATIFNPTTISHTLHTLDIHCTLNDALLGLLLAYAPALEELTVWGMALESDAHAHTTCRWRELACHGMFDIGHMACIPISTGDGMGSKMTLAVDDLQCHVMTAEVELAAIQAAGKCRLKLAIEHPFRLFGLHPAEGIQVDEQPAALRAALNVLRAFAPYKPPQNMGIALTSLPWLASKWILSVSLLHALQRLPEWGRFSAWRVDWLTQASVYAALISQVPASFHDISLASGTNLSQAHIESICFGAVGRGRPLRIGVCRTDPAVLESIQQSLMQLDPAGHVLVAEH